VNVLLPCPAAGDLYGASAGGDLYGAGPAPQVEMTKRNKKVNYEDVYAELAKQNKNRTAEDTLLDSILNTEVCALLKDPVEVPS
jgi:hypothetical protein